MSRIIGRTATGNLFYDHPLVSSFITFGLSGSGKTTYCFDRARSYLRMYPYAPMMVLDASGTLTRQLYTWVLCSALYHEGTPLAQQAMRLLQRTAWMTTGPIDQGGVGFDVTKLSNRWDPKICRFHKETVPERVRVIMGCLPKQREDSLVFGNVHSIGRDAVSILVAAHRTIDQLSLLLDYRNAYDQNYLRGIVDDINKYKHLEEQGGHTLWRQCRELLPVDGNPASLYALSRTAFDAVAKSTCHMFRFLTDHPHLFSNPRLGAFSTYQEFHDSGGVLLVDSADPDETQHYLIRAALLHFWAASALHRPDASEPSVLLVDEKYGINFELVASTLVTARNSNAYIWASMQDPTQLGKAMDEVIAGMHALVHFHGITHEMASRYALTLGQAAIGAHRIPMEDVSEGETDTTSESRGSSRDERWTHTPGTVLDAEEIVDTRRALQEARYGHQGDQALSTATRIDGNEHVQRFIRTLQPASDQHGQGYSNSEQDGSAHAVNRSVTRRQHLVPLSEQLLAVQILLRCLPRYAAFHATIDGAAIVRHRDPILPPKAMQDRAERARARHARHRIFLDACPKGTVLTYTGTAKKGAPPSCPSVPPPPAPTNGEAKPYDSKRHMRPGSKPKPPVDGGGEKT